MVFSDPHSQLTGVAVSRSNGIFVNYQRWSDSYRFAVREVISGKVKPYPDESWNTDGKLEDAKEHFVCVQGVVANDQNVLWVVDAAAPLMGPVANGGAKIVGIDLTENRLVKAIAFTADVVGPDSYLNDIRVDIKLNPAYLTDSGGGGLVVVDLPTGAAIRRLAGDPSVLAQKETRITIDGQSVVGADGKTPEIHSDGIALSPDGVFSYYQALTSSRLNDKAVFRRDTPGGLTRILNDPRLEWPDTFSEGPHGDLCVTASHINESPRFNHGKSARTEPYAVFRFRP